MWLKTWNLFSESWETFGEKEKMPATGIFSFSLNDFKIFLPHRHEKLRLCCEELICSLPICSLMSMSKIFRYGWLPLLLTYFLLLIQSELTHYQTTNFRLFQIERVCRQQFQIWRKWQKVIQMGRKHFSHSVFKKACFPGASKGVIVWEWVKGIFRLVAAIFACTFMKTLFTSAATANQTLMALIYKYSKTCVRDHLY